MVRRYSIGDDVYVREVPNGNWVRYEDYAKELSDAKAQRDALREALAVALTFVPQRGDARQKINQALKRAGGV